MFWYELRSKVWKQEILIGCEDLEEFDQWCKISNICALTEMLHQCHAMLKFDKRLDYHIKGGQFFISKGW